ncbi:hypothetical protein Q7P35_003136 [Cladosporium inversicolor]
MDSENHFLLTGSEGWICGHLEGLLIAQGKTVHATNYRMENSAKMNEIFDEFQPTHVINCAGKTGRPNVDWCEDNRVETVRSNVIGTLMLAELCHERGVHLTNMATGCIYTSQYNSTRDTLTSAPFTETDPPNFGGSFYSFTKSRVEDIIRTTYPNCLTLRIRMPISDDLHPRSFVTKITKYDRVVNIPNSNSILHDLLPLTVAMAEHRETGVYNFTNPGAIGHSEVLSLYKQIVDPQFEWSNFTLEEQAEVVKAERSNCELDATKLMGVVERYQCEGVNVHVPEIREAYQGCFDRMVKNLQMEGGAPLEA